MCAPPCRHRCAPRRNGVHSLDDHPVDLRRRPHLVVQRDPGKIVNVYLQVRGGELVGAWRDVSRPLRRPPSLRPALHHRRRRLLRVEAGLLPLYPRRYQRRYPLKPVRGESAAEGQPLIDDHSRVSLRVPPHEALEPPICALDRTKPVGGLSICHVSRRPRARGPSRPLLRAGVGDRECACEL
eukprot:6199896-Pleurochrysis_carterae.AAC.1